MNGQCDQREPGCGQCGKRQQQCPGYRNLVDLMFRDENPRIIKKAKAKDRRRNGVASSPATPGTPITPALSPSEYPSALSPIPSTPGLSTPASPPATVPPPAQSLLQTVEPGAAPHTVKALPAILTPNSYASGTWQATSDSLLPSPDSEEYPQIPSVALPYSVTPSLQEKGTAFFFSKFVSLEGNSFNHRFDYVFDVWKPPSLQRQRRVDSVMSSMTAVGLAGLARVTNSEEMLECARKSYGAALRLTNLALRDKREALKDTTMLAVLILGIFEMVVGSQNPLVAWHEHINGAAALANMRGPNQFKTPAGIKMFLMLNYSVVISCIAKGVPMPPGLEELRKQIPRVGASSRDTMASLHTGQGCEPVPDLEPAAAINKLVQLRSELVSGALTQPEKIIARLVEIEEDFESSFARFPEAWGYQLVRVKKPNPAVLGDICHLYKSGQNSTTWSSMRSCRFLVLEMLRSELIKGFEAEPALFTTVDYLRIYHRTDVLLQRLNEAVVRSAPFVLCPFGPKAHSNDYVSIPTVVTVHEPFTRASSPRSSISGSSMGGSLPTTPTEEMKPPQSSRGQQQQQQQQQQHQPFGPTLLDPSASSNLSPEESEARFHLLASANNFMLIPLYFAGMSSVCTPEVKQYVVERLDAMWREKGVEQAQTAAAIVEERDLTRLRRKVRLPTAELKSASAEILREQKVACSTLLV